MNNYFRLLFPRTLIQNSIITTIVLMTPSLACTPTIPSLSETTPPETVTFEDTDPSPFIGGTITIERARNESNIIYYAIHWGYPDPQPPEGETRSFDATDPLSETPKPDGFGDAGGDCIAFPTVGEMLTKIAVDSTPAGSPITFEIPQGTKIAERNVNGVMVPASTFVVHTLYDDGISDNIVPNNIFKDFHNVRECLIRNSAEIINWGE